MNFINFFYNHNWIFKCYLITILLFNIFMFYYFVYIIPNPNKKNSNIYTKNDINFKYNLMFKKLIKISKNPIIFEYQLEQINIINPISNKIIQYKNDIQNIYNLKNKKNSTYKNYKKIKKTLLEKKLINIDDIIIKLLYINFL
jgi:hypothetical protein